MNKLRPSILEDIGTNVIRFIKLNVQRKVNLANNAPFKPYSLAYFLKKNKIRKHKGESLQAYKTRKMNAYESGKNNVTLQDRGDMYGAIMISDIKDESLTIGFENLEDAEIAYYHNFQGAGKGQVIRRFFALSAEQKRVIQKSGLLLVKSDKEYLTSLVAGQIKKAL